MIRGANTQRRVRGARRGTLLQKRTLGMTLVEILLVIGILSLIAAAVTPSLIRFMTQNATEVAVDNISSTIRKAQEYSLNGRNDDVWGVCMSGGDARLFRGGSCASPTFSEDLDIPSQVDVTGFNEITFSKLRGEPSSTLSILVSSEFDSVTIDLSAAGGLEVN